MARWLFSSLVGGMGHPYFPKWILHLCPKCWLWVLTCVLDGIENVFTDSDFWANVQRSLWTFGTFPYWVSNMDFLHAEISSDFHNLFMVFCNVDDEIFKFFEIVHWGTLFWNLKICLFLFIYFFADSWTAANFHFWEMLPLKDALFFTTKHVIDLFPVNLISLHLFLFCTAHFSCSFFFF